MAWTVESRPEARDEFAALDRPIQRRIQRFIDERLPPAMSVASTPPDETTAEPSELARLIEATGNSYYRKPFEKFAREGRISATWNGAAFFFGMYWLFRRGMPAYGFAYMVAGLFYFCVIPPWLFASFTLLFLTTDLSHSESLSFPIYCFAFSVASAAVFPCYANALYYVHLRRLMRKGMLAARTKPRGRVGDYVGTIVILALSALVAGTILPEFHNYNVRMNILQLLSAAEGPKSKISEYVGAHGMLPERPEQVEVGTIVKTRNHGEVHIEQGGTIRLWLTEPNLFAGQNLSGKSVVLTPVLQAGKITNWRCSGDIPPKDLPSVCRE